MRVLNNSGVLCACLLIFLVITPALLMTGTTKAQVSEPTPSTLKVGVYSSPPFVIKNSNSYSGMSVEIWERVAARLNVTSEYQEFQNYSDLVTATANGTVDAAVTNLTITEGRAEVLDFTHPWFDAGLRVMVHTGSGSNFSDIIDDLGDAGHLVNYAWLAVMLVVATAALTLFDRRFDPEFPNRWREGFSESFYHVMSVATSGRTSRKNLFGWAGRIWQAIWMVFGIAVIAYVTSSVASVMTASHLTNQINSVADLQGKIVGVRSGSIAEEFMKGAFVNTMPFNHIEDATAALLNEEIAAIVGDKPVLEYHAHANPDLPVEVVGGTFHPDKYGFAFTTGSPFTRPASVAIIGLQESGEIEKLRVKYFGVQP